MTPNDVNQRLKSRLDYEQKNPGPYAGPTGDMGLEVGDLVALRGKYAGWTKREIDSTQHLHITYQETDAEQQHYLRHYWIAKWDGAQNRVLAERVKQVAQRDAAQAQYYKNYLERWGPPKAYRDKTLANFKPETPTQKTALQVADWFPYYGPCDEDDNGQPTCINVVFAGPTGTGKTHLAAALYAFEWECHCSAEFVTASAFIRKFREGATKESVLLSRYGDNTYVSVDALDNGCQTLVVDDLGIETDRYAAEIFCEILDRRMGADLGSIFTTNLTPDEMHAWLGDRGYSRLMNRCLWIVLDGDDHRLRETRKK